MTGIDCEGRDWGNCDFYRNLVREKEYQLRKKKGVKVGKKEVIFVGWRR